MSNRLQFAALIAAIGLLSACTHVRIYRPDDAPGHHTGSVAPLGQLLGNSTTPVVLVFVHGVADHCRGYALGDENNARENDDAWLSPSAMRAIGLVPENHSQKDTQITAGELEVGGPSGLNLVLLRERDYLWSIGKGGTPLSVHAVEVTWSPMTRWIKNTLLGYDATETAVFPFIPGGSGMMTCRDDTQDQIGQQTPQDPWFSPPARIAGNASLKWGVLDRDLADAVIYAGTYGQAMQRGMAAALCRISGGTEKNGAPCEWPAPGSMRPGRFIFVTHSLGSRLLYDTLLNLMDPQRAHTDYPNFLPDSYQKSWTQAPVDVESIVGRTTGFYMMANQLTMLGLAHVPIDAPINVAQPHLFAFAAANVGVAVRTDPLVQLLVRRSRLPTVRQKIPELAVVSFNDTNDLLTWHIPPWYSVAGGGPYGVQFADVFVNNSIRWLWLLEWPASAHSGYFSNMDVWQVMYCGAKDGRMIKCHPRR